MPRSQPHPSALFSLSPLNARARAVVVHPDNSYLTSTLPDGTLVLDIGFHVHSKSANILATLGRNGDITLQGSSIAKIQCHFEINLESNVVLLCDKSTYHTTQVYGKNAVPFEYGRPRLVVVHPELNTIIGIGGAGRNLIQFELKWHQNDKETIEKVKKRADVVLCQEQNPRTAGTKRDDAATEMPSLRETRVHTPGPQQPHMRYRKMGHVLGSGTFGEVHKAIDIDSGNLMAVKILRRPDRGSQQEQWTSTWNYALKREVETLSRISHPNIVDYIGSQGWHEPQVEIFMGLKEGTLESLAPRSDDIALAVFRQMLQALDFLAWQGIVHRDVKPANILYISQPEGQYQFQLGDFGISNLAIHAKTSIGTPIYMAPEIFQNGIQTTKADVWSLLVTMLWTLDIRGFRQRPPAFASYEAIFQDVEQVPNIREMAIVNSQERASAAQMLVEFFNGEGLSTPWNQVPALPNRPHPAITVAGPSSAAAPAMAAGPSEANSADIMVIG